MTGFVKYKLFFLILFSLIYAQQIYAQKRYTNGYDIKKMRMLIQFCSNNLYFSNQGAIDQDSAMVAACQGFKVSHAMAYDEDYNDGSVIPGNNFIETQDISSAISFLPQQNRINKLKLSLSLGSYFLYKTGDKPEDLRKAYTYLSSAVALSTQLADLKWLQISHAMLGKYYFQIGDIENSGVSFQKSFSYAVQSGVSTATATALNNLATYSVPGSVEQLKYLNQSLNKYQSLKDKEKECEIVAKLSLYYFIKRDLLTAKKYQLKLLQLQRAVNFRHLHYTLISLAFISNMEGKLNESLQYSLEMVHAMETTRDTAFSYYFYTKLGDTYLSIGQAQLANSFYKKAIASFPRINNNPVWYKTYLSEIAATMYLNDHKTAVRLIDDLNSRYPTNDNFNNMVLSHLKGECYYFLKRPQLAERYLKKGGEYADLLTSLSHRQDVNSIYARSAYLLSKMGNMRLTKEFVNKAKATFIIPIKYSVTLDLEMAEAKVDSAEGKYLSTIKHLEAYQMVNDSVHTVQIEKKTAELQLKYETELKDQNIKSLTQTALLQKTKLEKSDFIRNVIMGTAILILIFATVIYYQYVQKQKANKLIMRSNDILKELVTDKEWLLREVHHRVKNNLHTVISLLESQAAYLENDALKAIEQSSHRIYAMSLIHQQLYQSEELRTIDVCYYLPELVRYLSDSFQIGNRIRIDVNVQHLELDASQAVPLGLILNEAITNAIKYAFPDNSTGHIIISMFEQGDETCVLEIIDNGVGLPLGFDISKMTSLGMKLIRGLSKNLGGTLTVQSVGGTQIKLIFKNEKISKKPRMDSVA